ncbi:MAG: hypothetical protein AB7W59_28465 [Acidimicrobiia bacterium]
MYVTAVLCPDPAAFVGWCRSRGFVASGDGAESRSGTWLAVRVLTEADLAGLRLDRVDYALDFWRRGERDALLALDAAARSRLHRPPPATGAAARSPRGR